MRHSDIKLTMQTYTDPRLLDVRGALDSLPDLPLPSNAPNARQATGTDGASPVDARSSPRKLALPKCKPGQKQSIPDKDAPSGTPCASKGEIDVTSSQDKRKDLLSSADKRSHESGREDLNFRPFGPEPNALAKLSYAPIIRST